MSGKRFVETFSTGIVTDTLTGKKYDCEMRIDSELLELFNKMAEHHQEVESGLKELKELGNLQFKQIKELAEENEQLKLNLLHKSKQLILISKEIHEQLEESLMKKKH